MKKLAKSAASLMLVGMALVFVIAVFMSLQSCVSTPPKVVAPASNPHYVLLGDSHSDFYGNARGVFGYFGMHLQEIVPNLGIVALSGSTPSWFVTGHAAPYGCTVTPNVSVNAVSCKTAPAIPSADIYIIEQGANMTGWAEAKIRSEASRLIAALGGKKCFWVGKPPSNNTSTAEELRLEGILKTAVAPCTYLTSRFFSFERGLDSEHLNEHAAGIWAEGIAKGLK